MPRLQERDEKVQDPILTQEHHSDSTRNKGNIYEQHPVGNWLAG